MICIKPASKLIALSALLALTLPLQAEQISVDREEYENLKKAVEYLMIQQKQAMETATRAEEKADEANEVANATAEVVEDSPLDAFEGISLGGYGEVHYNNLSADDSDRDLEEVDLHRFVLFVGKEFTDDLRFVSEFEIEHGGVEADGDPLGGEVEIEQAYIEYDVNDNAQVRGGVFLVPAGILNETHEPPTFYGVERNDVENVIIPSTWWEAGVGSTFRTNNGFSFDAALHSGLNFSGTSGRIRSARGKVSNQRLSDPAVTGRVKYTGIQGLELAASINHQTDPTQDDDTDAEDDFIDDATLYQAHAIYNRGRLGLRALYAQWDFSGDIEDAAGDIDEQFGWYLEPSFKVNNWLGLYARYEEVEGARVQDQFSQWEVGANWWPHKDVVVKFDYRDRSHDPEAEADGRDFDGFDLGIGYMF
ncbi:MAG: OprO/OprP family phosphate-selective porin [Gammaproteobacteria bacterium]|nr:OprO/OprP family phosphate-selective porin [Gammaproteobacteria bacterium]